MAATLEELLKQSALSQKTNINLKPTNILSGYSSAPYSYYGTNTGLTKNNVPIYAPTYDSFKSSNTGTVTQTNTGTGTKTGTTGTTYTYSPSTKDLQTRLNAVGANLVTDGLYGPKTQAAMAQYGSLLNTPTTTATNITATKPGTIDNLLNSTYSGLTPQEETRQKLLEDQMWQQSQAVFDPEAEQKRMLGLYQAQIDMLNNIYNDQLQRSRIENAPMFQNRIGSQVAMAARSGLLGSTPGQSMISNQEQENQRLQAQQDAVFAAQRNDAIARIYGQVANSVKSAQEKFEAAKAKSAEDFAAAIKARPEQRKKQITGLVSALLAEGIDIEELSPEELSDFAKKLNVSTSDIVSVYNTEKSANEQAQLKTNLENAYKEAQTKKIVKETEQIGKMSPYQAAMVGISQGNLKIAQEKWAEEKTGKKESSETNDLYEIGMILSDMDEKDKSLALYEAKQRYLQDFPKSGKLFDEYFGLGNYSNE